VWPKCLRVANAKTRKRLRLPSSENLQYVAPFCHTFLVFLMTDLYIFAVSCLFSLLQEIGNLLNMADSDGTNEDGIKSVQVTEEPLGILQLINKLEDIVDQMTPG